MTTWQNAIVSVAFGVFLYCVVMQELLLAIIPVSVIALVAVVQGLRDRSTAVRAPIGWIAVIFLLIVIAQILPESVAYAAGLGLVSAAVVYAALSRIHRPVQ